MDRLGEALAPRRGRASTSRTRPGRRTARRRAPRAIAASRPPLDAEEALGRALAGQERAVALVDVAREQLARCRRRCARRAASARPSTSAASRAAISVRMNCARRDEHLAAHVAALLLGRELVLEVHAGGAGLDHRLHQLEGVERAAEAGLGVGDDRREPVRSPFLPSACSIWSARRSAWLMRCTTCGHAVRRVEALVGVHLPGEVRVGRDLPAARGRSP